MKVDFYPSSKKFEPHAVLGRVAILTRTKDRPVLLARAFSSVLNQTHGNWHLYLVNDGGDSKVVDDICKEYESAFAGRLTVIHHARSLGMEAASNAALSAAEGEYIVVHDDDDSWHPTFLARTIDFLSEPQNAGYAAVVTNLTVVTERIEADQVIELGREPWGYWRPHVDMLHLLSRNGFPPISLLVRRSAADAIGVFNHHLPVLGDWDFHLRLMVLADIGTISDPLAYYHHRAASADATYGNSVTAGIDRHQLFDTLYRNSLVRQLLQKNPEQAGAMHLLLRSSEELHKQSLTESAERHRDLANQLTALSAQVNALAHGLNHTLNHRLTELDNSVQAGFRPMRGIWRRLLPLRIVVAKLRGRR